MTMLTDLDVALANRGIPFTPVGFSTLDPTGAADWRTRGRPASTGRFDPEGVLCHHTAAPSTATTQSSLNVVLRGNGQAPGPIATLYLSREPAVYLIAAGRCNHGGRGIRPGVDSGCQDMNRLLLGIEVDNNGIGEPWSDALIVLYARCVEALCAHYHWNIATQVWLHATTGPPSGPCNSKIDPAGPWLRQPDLRGTWDLNTWRAFCAEQGGSTPPPQPPQGGDDLVHTLIKVTDAYAVFTGDSDNLGIVHSMRWVGPGLNQQIGFQADNTTPRLAGTKVLERKQAELNTITLVGPVPTGDKVPWTAANFYQGG